MTTEDIHRYGGREARWELFKAAREQERMVQFARIIYLIRQEELRLFELSEQMRIVH